MKEPEVETIVQRALEKHPGRKPRIISNNGPQFIAKDLKQVVRLAGITHIRTSPYSPQSNGKFERWHGALKSKEFRDKAPCDVAEARRVIGGFVSHSNEAAHRVQAVASVQNHPWPSRSWQPPAESPRALMAEKSERQRPEPCRSRFDRL